MKLHIYIDSSDIEPSRLDEIHAPISEEIATWVGDKKTIRSLTLIDPADSESSDKQENDSKL